MEKRADQLSNKKNTMTVIEQLAEIRAEEAMAEGIEKGLAEGRAMEREKAIRLFLTNTEFSVEKIAELLEAPIALVKKIKKELART
jgi:flagellar biosynthesis/type III secretory pathway protein FliH